MKLPSFACDVYPARLLRRPPGPRLIPGPVKNGRKACSLSRARASTSPLKETKSNQQQRHQHVKTINAEPETRVTAEVIAILQSISEPVGSFGGSEDRVIRIRNGQVVAADTGGQGGGQN
jgi:hypothetical protein